MNEKPIRLGTARARGGYFLTKRIARHPFARESVQSPQFLWTYDQSARTLKKALLGLIENATEKLFLVSFRIGDDDLLRALIAAAKRLRGGVYVITALDEKSLADGVAESEDDNFEGDSLKKQYEKLTRNGIYARGHSSCHAKFAVADDNHAVIGTANFEPRAFEKTGECGVVLSEKADICQLAKLFTHLWFEGCEWEIPPGEGYTVQKRNPTASPCSPPVQQSSSRVIWTCEKEHFILQSIQSLVAYARRQLLLASFSLDGMTRHPDLLLDLLADAIQKRGVQVRMVVRARNAPLTQRIDAEGLARIGVEVAGDSLNHAKMVIADASRGAVFSANFDATHGLTAGVEVGVRLDNQSPLPDLIAFHRHSFENADAEFVLNPRGEDMAGKLCGRVRAAWPLPSHLIVTATPSEWRRLESEATESITLFTMTRKDAVNLHVGRTNWELLFDSAENSEIARIRVCGESNSSAEDELGKWIMSRDVFSGDRGVCAATLQLAPQIK